MNEFDAYEDEMTNLDGLSDRDLDRLVSGRDALDGSGLEALAAFLRELRVACTEPPEERVAATHLAAVAEEAGRTRAARRAAVPVRPSAARAAIPSAKRSRRSPRAPRKRLALLAAALVVAAPLLTAGLALAGVSLPDAARAPFDGLGIDLPNQSRAADVHAVIDTTSPDDRGCEFGQRVASAASGGKAQPTGDPCAQGQGGGESGKANAAAGEHGGGNSGAEPGAGEAFGQETAQDAQQNASTDGQAFGQRTSERAQQLAPDHPSGPPEGSGEPQGSPDTGASQSEAGGSTSQGTPAGDHAP